MISFEVAKVKGKKGGPRTVTARGPELSSAIEVTFEPGAGAVAFARVEKMMKKMLCKPERGPSLMDAQGVERRGAWVTPDVALDIDSASRATAFADGGE